MANRGRKAEGRETFHCPSFGENLNISWIINSEILYICNARVLNQARDKRNYIFTISTW